MPIRILLADKSITIQKVVEMLFSGKEYEVVCVSDGETALSEAERVIPDVVLADVDLPRIDGYSFAERLRQAPLLAQTPVILMMSRDDTYNAEKGKQAGIVDNIAKPFESQELIGKVKKALVGAPRRHAEPVAAASLHATPVVPQAAAESRAALSAPKPTPDVPDDIFDIIGEAPTSEDVKRAAAPAEEEPEYEVEPEVEEVEEPRSHALTSDVVKRAAAAAAEEGSAYEIEPEVEEVEEKPLVREAPRELPTGAKAVAEMRAGLGLTAQREEFQPNNVTSGSPGTGREDGPATAVQQPVLSESELRTMAESVMTKMAREAFEKAPPSQLPMISASEVWSIAEEKIAKMAKDVFAEMAPIKPPSLPESELRAMAEKTIAKMAGDLFENMPPPQPPKISEETVRRGIEDAVSKIAREVAREVIEKVVWEVVPHLAEVMIKEEIERLKAEP